MRKLGMLFCILSVLLLSGCSSGGGLFSTCDPRFQHCGTDPHMQDEISDEVGQML